MTEDGVCAADTAQTQSSERCHERGACQRAPLIPLSSSSIRGLSLFPFERVTLIELVGRQMERINGLDSVFRRVPLAENSVSLEQPKTEHRKLNAPEPSARGVFSVL